MPIRAANDMDHQPQHYRARCRRALTARRRGLSLTELLIAGTIMAMLAGGMGTLVMTVHSTNDYCRGQAIAAQHARVTLDRIDRAVRLAHTSESFPGCLVVSESASGYDFPDTLVVWSPIGAAADPNGLPRAAELAIYCPDPALPQRLIELRDAGNTSVCPPLTNVAGWATLVDSLKSSASATKVELTDRVRTASTSGGSGDLRACVRFRASLTPSASDWTAYKAGTLAWKDVSWPLDYYSTQTGMRRVVCQTELQVLPSDASAAQVAVPFFGSATLTYELSR
jgi:Tfp pilus assembly protein PilW